MNLSQRRLMLFCASTFLGASLLYLSPGGIDAEHWSWYRSSWATVALVVLFGGHLLLLFGLGARFARVADHVAVAAPIVWTAPAVVLKPVLTAGRAPLPLDHLLLAGPLLLLLSALASAGMLPAERRAMARLGLVVPLVAMVFLAAVRWGELADQEEVVASGRVEELVRALADRVGEDVAAHGRPSADGSAWLARLAAPGWSERDGLWFWAPRDGLEPTCLRLRYRPPTAEDGPWATILETVPVRLVSRRARRFSGTITGDGGVTFTWPDGPPEAVERRRAAVP